jgi:SpoVK/Ycf46/Vps4 family AAA+-type ATPase
MASADQIKALIKSHADGDDTRFYSIAIQVAAHAARSGHSKLAQELRQIIDQMQLRADSPKGAPIPLAQPRGPLAELLVASYPKVRLTDMTLSDDVRTRLDRVVREYRERERIREHGFTPLHKILLVGPPGTGKTMTAHALAGELGLPLCTVQLHGLITKFMGETAAKLRLIFDAVVELRAVYLFDEFDALGGERASTNDVGEIRRVLNSFLLFLEQDPSDSLIVAATNHPTMLDRALFRRFDLAIQYQLPTAGLAERVLRARLALLDTAEVDWSRVIPATEGLSHAEISKSCEHAAKNALLERRLTVDTDALLAALDDRRMSDR